MSAESDVDGNSVLSCLSTIFLNYSQTLWQQVTVDWYAGQSRQMNITSQSAVWYHSGKVPVPIRWVLVRDPQGKYEPVALLSTSLELDPVQLLNWFVRRRQVGVTLEERLAPIWVWKHSVNGQRRPLTTPPPSC